MDSAEIVGVCHYTQCSEYFKSRKLLSLQYRTKSNALYLIGFILIITCCDNLYSASTVQVTHPACLYRGIPSPIGLDIAYLLFISSELLVTCTMAHEYLKTSPFKEFPGHFWV